MVNETVKKTRALVSSLISLIFLLYVIFLIDLKDFLFFISTTQVGHLFLIFSSVIMILLLRSFRWSLLIRCKLDFPILFLFYYSLQSQFINSWMPNGSGDVIKVVLLKSRSKNQLAELVTLTMIDRLLDVIIIMIGGFTALFMLEIFPVDLFWILSISCLFGAIFFFVVLIILKIPDKIIRNYPKLATQFRILIVHRKEITFSFFITLIAWLFEAIKLFFIFNGLKISVDLFISLQIALVAWIGSLLLILVSGTLGTKEFFMSYILQENGFDKSISSLASILDRIFTIMISFLVFGFFMVLNTLGLINEKITSFSNSDSLAK